MPELTQWQDYANRNSAEIEQRFSNLTVGQLNWKPAPDSWSVGECIRHLIVTNTSYFPQFEQIINGTKKKTFWERLPLSKFWGNFLKKATGPIVKSKTKTQPIWDVNSSNEKLSILDEFRVQQNQLLNYIRVLGKDSGNIIITSPAAAFITYSLKDAFDILIQHEERHIRQAERLTAAEGFPKS